MTQYLNAWTTYRIPNFSWNITPLSTKRQILRGGPKSLCPWDELMRYRLESVTKGTTRSSRNGDTSWSGGRRIILMNDFSVVELAAIHLCLSWALFLKGERIKDSWRHLSRPAPKTFRCFWVEFSVCELNLESFELMGCLPRMGVFDLSWDGNNFCICWHCLRNLIIKSLIC